MCAGIATQTDTFLCTPEHPHSRAVTAFNSRGANQSCQDVNNRSLWWPICFRLDFRCLFGAGSVLLVWDCRTIHPYAYVAVPQEVKRAQEVAAAQARAAAAAAAEAEARARQQQEEDCRRKQAEAAAAAAAAATADEEVRKTVFCCLSESVCLSAAAEPSASKASGGQNSGVCRSPIKLPQPPPSSCQDFQSQVDTEILPGWN